MKVDTTYTVEISFTTMFGQVVKTTEGIPAAGLDDYIRNELKGFHYNLEGDNIFRGVDRTYTIFVPTHQIKYINYYKEEDK